MANPPPVVVVEKKRGIGCCGCGCLSFLLVVVVLAALIAGVGYLAYKKLNSFTAAAPVALQTFDGGEELYNSTTKKLTDFDQTLQHHQAATLHLNANEINTLIARDSDFKDNKIQAFVTITGDTAELKVSIPLSLTANLVNIPSIKSRYLNSEIAFGFDFDPQNKALNLLIKKFVLGDENVPKDYLSTLQGEFDPAFNQMLQNDSTGKSILDQAKSIEIKNGELVIVTE